MHRAIANADTPGLRVGMMRQQPLTRLQARLAQFERPAVQVDRDNPPAIPGFHQWPNLLFVHLRPEPCVLFERPSPFVGHGASPPQVRFSTKSYKISRSFSSLTQTARSPRPSFNLCVADAGSYRDVDVSVAVQALRGK